MEEDSICKRRAKRQKIDKSGRSAAFERLKSLKGKKNKCDIGEVENVYDEVDEKEYSKRVLERQEEDWLEGSEDGYIEDGREIFDDDDEDDERILERPKRAKTSKKKNVSKNSYKTSKSILEMVTNMPAKKKGAENDDVLNNIMGELCSEFESKPAVDDSVLSKDYLNSISKVKPKPKINDSLSSKEYLNSITKPREKPTMDDNVLLEECPNSISMMKPKPSMDDSVSSKEYLNSISNLKEKPTIDDNMSSENYSDSIPEVKEKLIIDDSVYFEDCPDLISKVHDTNLKAENAPKEVEDLISSVNVMEPCSSNLSEIGLSSEMVSNKVNNCNFFIDKSDLPLVTNEEGERVFRFFWWDAYEDPLKQAGTVYLFGKVFHEGKKAFVSCCVCVENIERRIFLLPREKRFDCKKQTASDIPVTLLDVYQEFNDTIANPNKIMNFKSRKVVRKYAFDLGDVPEESEYLEVKYPSNYVRLSQDLAGETFSRVFGTNTTSLELLLLEQKIKGPCWLEIKNPQLVKVPFTWCKIETRCTKLEDVVVSKNITPFPPLTVMAIHVRTVVNTKNMDNEIVMIAAVVQNDCRLDKPPPNPPFHSHFCAFTRPANKTWPHDLDSSLPRYRRTETVVHHAERSLLNYFLTKLYTIDPDVVVGHDLYGFTLDTLMHRIQHLKIGNWSRIGRLRRSLMPQLKGKQAEKSITCGRLVCDVNISARELIRARSYDLNTLCKQILNVKEDSRQELSSEEIIKKYDKTPEILNLIGATVEDAIYILRLMHELNVLPLALQITNIAGNVMSRTLLGGRSERNEFLLLHAFTEKNYLVPDKNTSRKTIAMDEEAEMAPKNARKKPQYAGGLVLEPKKGFYDKFILLMDFNSLYPSIIQEYNICFTTIARTEEEDAEPEVPSPGLPLGILPTEIQKLVESRRRVKELMKAQDLSPELRMQYNIRQMALKLTANSMYGCLGFSFSRFYAKPLAALVTRKGREILLNTKEIVQKMNYEVIYGDTDSIMINTNCTDYDEVFRIGRSIKQEINRLYRYLELEVDGVFKYMLLLKKKKYAAIALSKKPSGELVATQEYKGLDIVRRDWCQLSAEVGRHILNQILSDQSPDERIGNIRDHLERIGHDMRNKLVPVPLLAITKQLTKNPEDYPDKKSLPHLQVALRVNSRGGKKLRAGDTVSYVICDDGSNLPAVQRAYHVDELKSNENLLVDINYYLSQQIHPVVSRLCEPVDGADGAFIAECLGLDPSVYRRMIQRSQEDEDEDAAGDYMLINDIQSFKNCEKFSFSCINEKCKTKIFMDAPMRDNRPVLSKCRNPSCSTSPIEYLPSILNALNLSIRHHVSRLYQNWMTCTDPACSNRTQRVPMSFTDSFPNCTLCRKSIMSREYKNADLYYQLKFYEFIFNIKRLKLHMDPVLENGYKVLHDRAVQALDQSAYRILDFSKIFKFTLKIKKKEGGAEKEKPCPSHGRSLVNKFH